MDNVIHSLNNRGLAVILSSVKEKKTAPNSSERTRNEKRQSVSCNEEVIVLFCFASCTGVKSKVDLQKSSGFFF